jgi:site-specific recombinase XerC
VAAYIGHAVRGPKHVVKTGKTTVLDADQARTLLDSIDTSTVIGLRDRALIALMTYSFARVSAAMPMDVEDYLPKGKRWWVRLHEKGGKDHELPAHHNLEAYLDAYIEAAGIREDKKGPLFRSANRRTGTLTGNRMHRVDAWRMVQRRAAAAGFDCARRQSFLSRDGYNRLSQQRRHIGERAIDGRAREPTHDVTLRPHRQ